MNEDRISDINKIVSFIGCDNNLIIRKKMSLLFRNTY